MSGAAERKGSFIVEAHTPGSRGGAIHNHTGATDINQGCPRQATGMAAVGEQGSWLVAVPPWRLLVVQALLEELGGGSLD